MGIRGRKVILGRAGVHFGLSFSLLSLLALYPLKLLDLYWFPCVTRRLISGCIHSLCCTSFTLAPVFCSFPPFIPPPPAFLEMLRCSHDDCLHDVPLIRLCLSRCTVLTILLW